MIEHLKQRTIPHDLLEYFTEVSFYEGCMIVQIHDHKSLAPSQGAVKPAPGTGKVVPFSVHNYNAYLTPSSYEPFPTQPALAAGKTKVEDEDSKAKSTEQKDKENMPAPSLPGDGQRRVPKKAKVITVVLHPTPLCNLFDFANKAADSRSIDGRRESRHDINGGPLSASVPPTPSTAVPATPQTMAPPAKRVKKTKMQLDSTNLYSKEAQIILATTAPLKLEPINSVNEAVSLLDSLAHPMHSAKPPAPKTRKRTVAEMAADEALAADQERYMLVLDERLSSTAGAQGGANSTGDGGQAGGASFEPRFERFTLLEGIKSQHEENKKAEKLRAAEAERKRNQEQERNKLRDDAEKREQQKLQMQATAAQQQNAQRQHQQQELNRRQMAEQAQRSQMQNMAPQSQAAHAHPQSNGIPTNMPAQTQRFHQQQATQGQLSSPIVRNGTPQSHSSPSVNNMGNVPMQHSTSSMGGSPPRPGSVVQQNHPQMSAPTSHGMVAQRSQQSHAGTPRMPNSTPNMQSTPINRQMSQQTPRMSQASPQNSMPQTPQMPMMNGQPQMAQAQMSQAQFQQQQARMAQMQQMMRSQQQQQAAQGMMQGQLTPQQQLQIQMMRTQQQQALQQQQAMPNQLIQNYAAQMAAMSARSGGMTPNMNQNFNPSIPNNMQMNPAQMQQLRQQQIMQAQAQAQQHAMQQAQQHHPQGQAPMNQNQMIQQQIMGMASKLFQQEKMKLAGQYPGGLPDEVAQQVQQRCQVMAQRHVQTLMQKQAQARAQQQQAQMMAAQQGMAQNMNGMQNGMGM